MESINIANLKKIELHCHLLGVISPSLLQRLHRGRHLIADMDEFASIYPIKNLAGFNQWLAHTKPYQNAQLNVMLPILEAHIKDLIEQNVIYTELMISPLIFPKDREQMVEAFEMLRSKICEFEKGLIQVEFIMSIPRNLPQEAIKKDLQEILELHRLKYIVGVALVGIESGQSIDWLYPHLSMLKDNGIGIEIHAGEHSGPQSVIEALEYGLADRIGHGIGAFQNESVIERLLKSKVHLEFCISSNLQTNGVVNIEKHPIVQALAMGMNFSVNTDDPGIFQCSMNSEFQMLSDYFRFNKDDFEIIFSNSFSSRFAK